jgi:hypothetical protein
VEEIAKDALKIRSEASSYYEEYKRRVLEDIRKNFTTLLGDLINTLPKIKAVYKPTLRNADFCSLGMPDFLLETEEGNLIIEVKNVANLKKAVSEGVFELQFYRSLIEDESVSVTEWGREELFRPSKCVLVCPRQGLVREIRDPFPSYREIATEIWKIKRAALVEGKLPETRPVSSICGRCGFKRFCKEGESLEKAKPLPLIYEVARNEAGEKFWKAVYYSHPKWMYGTKDEEESRLEC